MVNALKERVKPLFFLFIFIIFSLVSCKKKDRDTEIHHYITSHYSVEEINAFYERCFNDTCIVEKWRWCDSVKYFIGGDTIVGDHAFITQIAQQLSNAIAPLSISETKDKNEANMRLMFVPSSLIDSSLCTGGATKTHRNIFFKNEIDSVNILLSKEERGNTRKNTIVHELLHGVGVCSHTSTNYMSAIFFKLNDDIVDLTQEDLQSVKILYEPIMKQCKTIADMERIFAKELYHINSEQKFCNYLQTKEYGRQIADSLNKYAFLTADWKLNGKICKYINNLPLHLHIESDEELDTLKQIATEINRATPFMQLNINQNNFITKSSIILKSKAYTTIVIKGALILFTFQKDNKVNKDSLYVDASYKRPNFQQKFITYYNTVFDVRYNDSIVNLCPRVGKLLYERLILKGSSSMGVLSKDIFEKRDGKYYLKPFYRELLEVYYSPHLPHNFTKSQMEKVIEMLH